MDIHRARRTVWESMTHIKPLKDLVGARMGQALADVEPQIHLMGGRLSEVGNRGGT